MFKKKEAVSLLRETNGMIPNVFITVVVSILIVMLAVWVAVLIRNDIKEYRYIGQSEEQKHSIFISGEGRVTAIPDIATIHLGMQAEHKDIVAAQKETTTAINTLLNQLKTKFNIEARDIATANYSVYPQYDWVNGRQILRAYQVNQEITVKVRDLGKIGDILQIAAEAKLNQVGGLTFDIDDPRALEQEAREAALKNAQEKARSLASVAGVTIGRILSFSEYASEPQYNGYDYSNKTMMGRGGVEANAAPEIPSGSGEIVVQATVEYEIE